MPAVRGAPAPGQVLDGRYTLQERVPVAGVPEAEQDALAQLWRAEDSVLARLVAAKTLPARLKAERQRAEQLLATAGAAGAVGHPGLVRVYDATVQTRPGGDLAVVLSEWVDGQALAVHLQQGPLDVPEAADLVQQAADALTALHAAGLEHGRLHPGNVLVTAAGRLRLTDAGIGAVLHPSGPVEPGVGWGERPVPVSGGVAADTRDLAAVAYALLTGRWPGGSTPQPGRGVPESSGRDRLLVPTKVRAGLPRSTDTVLLRALDPLRAPSQARLDTPARFAAALEEVAVEVREHRALAALPKRRNRLLLVVPYLLALAFLVAVGVGGYQLGIATGTLPRRAGTVDTLDPTVPQGSAAPSAGASARPAVALRPVTITDFDPPPGDGSESPDQVPNATDGDPSTAWTTTRYKTAQFGGLKKGVGLLVDLGRPTRLGVVRLLLTTPGASVELRTSDTVPSTADDLAVVATQTGAPTSVALTPPAGTTARYVLVWITQLPGAPGGGFRAGIAELALTS